MCRYSHLQTYCGRKYHKVSILYYLYLSIFIYIYLYLLVPSCIILPCCGCPKVPNLGADRNVGRNRHYEKIEAMRAMLGPCWGHVGCGRLLVRPHGRHQIFIMFHATNVPQLVLTNVLVLISSDLRFQFKPETRNQSLIWLHIDFTDLTMIDFLKNGHML